MGSSDRFGYEWNRYSHLERRYEDQFRNWTHPLTQADFSQRTVLDAGCGMGRNSYWPLVYGAQQVTAFDFDERSVRSARRALSSFPNADVQFGSIYDITWQDEFDLALCIGVIHHLHAPVVALSNLVRALKTEGTLLIWVYSFEGNEWIPRLVDPARKAVTSKLSPGLVHGMSYLCSIPLFAVVRLLRGPTPYLRQLSSFSFRHVHSIVFDQLIPEIACYWRKDQVEALAEELPLSSFEVYQPPNGNGWILRGTKR